MLPSNVSRTENFSSQSALKQMWIAIRLLGLGSIENHKNLYKLFAIVLHSIVTFYCPFSLVVSLFLVETREAFIGNLTLATGFIICSSKILNTAVKCQQINDVSDLIKRLDSRVTHQDEKDHLNYTLKMSQRFWQFLLLAYIGGGASWELPVIFSDEKHAIYPVWLPIDWKEANKFVYYTIHLYMGLVISTLIYANLLNDSFPGILLWLLRGHLYALGSRIKRIGFDANESGDASYEALVNSVKDYQVCKEYFKLCRNILSTTSITQFIGTQVILCVTAIHILFIGGDFIQIMSLFFYFACMILEISLLCYCGSELTAECNRFITYLYSCNWMDQDQRFRRVLIIFMQDSQKSWIIWGGGIVSVSLDTWLAVLKSAYSLFAVFSQIA